MKLIIKEKQENNKNRDIKKIPNKKLLVKKNMKKLIKEE